MTGVKYVLIYVSGIVKVAFTRRNVGASNYRAALMKESRRNP